MSATREQHAQLDVQIRWLIRRDMQEVLRIESASFEFPWTDEDFLCCLRQRNCIGMVAEHDHKIVGFMIYELHKSRLQILNFAVAPEVRRHGVGKQMVLRLVDKLSQQRRNEIMLECRERNLDGQLFFRNQGFGRSAYCAATTTTPAKMPTSCSSVWMHQLTRCRRSLLRTESPSSTRLNQASFEFTKPQGREFRPCFITASENRRRRVVVSQVRGERGFRHGQIRHRCRGRLDWGKRRLRGTVTGAS